MSDVSQSEPRAATYRERVERFDAEARAWQRRSDRFVNLRFATAGFVVAALAIGWWQGIAHIVPWLIAAAFGALAFIVVVARHRWIRRRQERAAGLATLNRHGLARLDRAWNKLPSVATPPDVQLTATARDLDLFGPASLFRLCCLAATGLGRRCLAGWLLTPAAPEEISARQEAVAELAAQLDLRQELAWRGQVLESSRAAADVEPLVRWAEATGWLAKRPWLVWYARLSPILLLALVAVYVLGFAPAMLLGQVVVGLHVAVSYLLVRHVHEIFRQIDTGEQQLHRFSAMLALVETWPVTAPQLLGLQNRLSAGGHRAHEQLTRLRRRLNLADLRFSQVVYGVVQVISLWDFHVLSSLERWKRQVGPHLREWLDALAQFEALCSLSTLAFDNPSWSFPVVDPSGPRLIAATALAHPLIPVAHAVGNDVEVGPAGTFLLVTGSNMSGKSTLLRAIGVNLVLAQAGAPVAARRLSLPRVLVETSMRIDDSLADGVSLFLAELKRLKAIVEQARNCNRPGGPVLVFLLDEILHGTNSRDRQIAVRRVVDRLLAQQAIGAVSTHDLELAAAPPLSESCRAVHFRETFEGAGAERQMKFDYELRPGIACTTNALALLDMVGLADEQHLHDPNENASTDFEERH
ncbi:MAG TPA: hypothetical protein VHD36_08610 [Pirellulales bacterium]|nr:hypothetical protein [Pirellulales bacterium]